MIAIESVMEYFLLLKPGRFRQISQELLVGIENRCGGQVIPLGS